MWSFVVLGGCEISGSYLVLALLVFFLWVSELIGSCLVLVQAEKYKAANQRAIETLEKVRVSSYVVFGPSVDPARRSAAFARAVFDSLGLTFRWSPLDPGRAPCAVHGRLAGVGFVTAFLCS